MLDLLTVLIRKFLAKLSFLLTDGFKVSEHFMLKIMFQSPYVFFKFKIEKLLLSDIRDKAAVTCFLMNMYNGTPTSFLK